MVEVEQPDGPQARALRALRPLMLLAGVPAAALFLALELQQGRASVWMIGLGLAVVIAVASLADRAQLERRAPVFVVSFVGFSLFAFLHFGSQVGAGLLFAAATLCAGFFLGRTAAIVSASAQVFVVALGTLGLGGDWVPTSPALAPDSTVGVRMVVTATVSLALLVLVFLRVQQTLQAAQTREIQARAERQVAERERERALETALQAQRLEATGRLASGVAHDFNNALMVLQGTLELIGMVDDAASREQLIDEGLAAIAGASATARQLLDLSRPGGELDGRCEPGPLLERFARSIRRVLPETLRFDVSIEDCPEIPLGETMLEQILLNLIINARDATEGQGTIYLRCRSGPAGEALVEVADTGAGMSEDTRLRLFEPFFTTKDPQRGTGLGLSMVHALVTHSGGTIEVESELGRGTRFVMRWPPARAGEAEAAAALALAPAPSAEQPAAILVIEQHRDVARVMARTLTQAGFAVTSVYDLQAAREQLGRQRFALVCTDVLLPDGTAVDVIAAQREAGAQSPVLVCTGYLERPELAAVLHEGARLLRKPFALAHLVDHARAAMDEVRERAADEVAPIDPPARQG